MGAKCSEEAHMDLLGKLIWGGIAFGIISASLIAFVAPGVCMWRALHAMDRQKSRLTADKQLTSYVSAATAHNALPDR